MIDIRGQTAKAGEHSAVEDEAKDIRIGLALSGGGVRAAAFHAGVLKYLAEQRHLERVQHISSVSGGSLFVGLVVSRAGYSWPTSQQYLDHIYEEVRHTLTTTSLQRNALMKLLFNPMNWRYALSRANVIEKSIRSVWKIDLPLRELRSRPTWSINGTTAETGRRFRFRDGEFGDYELGYADSGDFRLSSALAVSAAFPGGIGPLSVKTRRFQWKKRKEWNRLAVPEEINLQFKRLHLYDGGVYDNLGLEPLFDMGKQTFKENPDAEINRLIVSDAGARLPKAKIPGQLNPLRFKRIADIALDQTRALRVRSLSNFLLSNLGAGLYLEMGADARSRIQRASSLNSALVPLMEYEWLNPQMTSAAAALATSLKRMTPEQFDLLARHGYEVTYWNDRLWRTPPTK